MAKFNFSIDWEKVAKGVSKTCGDILSAGMPLIVSGGATIGLALLCKKLNIPYDVLTDPYGLRVESKASGNQSSYPSTIMLLPNNPIEAGIAAVTSTISTSSSEYYIAQAADQIKDILSSNQSSISASTMTYAITMLRTLADKCRSSYYRNEIIEIIADISKGDF